MINLIKEQLHTTARSSFTTFKSGSQQGSELHVCVSVLYDYYSGLVLANYVNMSPRAGPGVELARRPPLAKSVRI